MAIGVAFVDILGDTSRAAPQIERDMNRVVAVVNDAIDPAEIRAAVEAGTEADLTREINQDLRAVSAAIQRVQVSAELSPEARANLERQLRETTRRLRAARAELEVRVDERGVIAQVTEVAAVAEAVAPTIDIETNVDTDRVARDFTALGKAASAAGPLVGRLSLGLVGIGSAIPAISGAVSAMVALAPAAAVAAPAVLAVKLAMGAFQLATIGVKDAVKTAFDPSNPKKYAKALEQLSPNARDFVEQLHAMQPALKDVQQGVQDRVFAGLSSRLKELSSSALPVLRSSLFQAGDTLNVVAKSVSDTAEAISDSGELGKALSGANAGLSNLADVPGRVVSALGQLASAAAPAFVKLTSAADGAFGKLSGALDSAAQSGALQNAIEMAVSLLGDLASIAVNVFKIVTQIFTVSSTNGAGLIQTILALSDALVQAFANPAIQAGLQVLFRTVGMLSSTVMPLLGTALGVVANALVALAPGVQTLIQALGVGLQPIIVALGPVLLAAAQAVSGLLMAISPLFPIIGLLVSQLGGILTPILNALSLVFQAIAPVIAEVAQILGTVLGGVLSMIPGLLQPFLDQLVQLSQQLFPLVLQLLVALEPSIMQLMAAFEQVFAALSPLIPVLSQLAFKLLAALIPILPPIITFVGQLAAMFANNLALALTQIVVPAIRVFTSLLNGDGQGALRNFKQVVSGVVDLVVREFVLLPVQIVQALGTLASTLFNIGNNIMASLGRGILSGLGKLGSVLGTVTQFIADHKGPIERDRQLLVPAGQAIMQGLISGIESQTQALDSTLSGVTKQITTAGGGIPVSVSGVMPSGAAAQSFARTAPGSIGRGPLVANVFIGGQKIAEMVSAEMVAGNAAAARRITTGARI